MLGWVHTILPSKFKFNFERVKPQLGFQDPPKTSVPTPTLMGKGINTHTNTLWSGKNQIKPFLASPDPPPESQKWSNLPQNHLHKSKPSFL